MKRLILAGALTFALLPIGGCKTTTTASTSTPSASTGYQNAATAMLNFSTDLSQAQQIEISLYHAGLQGLDKPTHVAIQTGFLQVATYGKQIDALIASQASALTIQAKVSAAIDSVQAIAASTTTLDPTASAQLNLALAALKAVLQGTMTALSTNTSTVSAIRMPSGLTISHPVWINGGSL